MAGQALLIFRARIVGGPESDMKVEIRADGVGTDRSTPGYQDHDAGQQDDDEREALLHLVIRTTGLSEDLGDSEEAPGSAPLLIQPGVQPFGRRRDQRSLKAILSI
jgi:hypothetical protein